MRDNVNATLPTVPDTHIPTGSLITVSIGRNVKDGRGNVGPMPWAQWSQFLTDTRRYVQLVLSVRDAKVPTFGPFLGTGEWEGVTEESATFTFITPAPVPPGELSLTLAVLARHYGQDAIAWSYGPALLATA